MSILDGKLEFMDATSIAAANAVSVGGDVLDLGVAYDAWDQSITPDIGEGGGIYFNCRIATTLTTERTMGAHTIYAAWGGRITDAPSILLCTHTAPTGMMENGTTLINRKYALTNATSVAGQDVIRIKVPAGDIKRYLVAISLAGTSTIPVGALDAWLSLDTESGLPIT